MIAVFGANGKTGREIIREALHRGVEVRPVVRDDYDTAHLDDIVNVNELCFADADQPSSIPPALEGCDAVVCCIDARTSWLGSSDIYIRGSCQHCPSGSRCWHKEDPTIICHGFLSLVTKHAKPPILSSGYCCS